MSATLVAVAMIAQQVASKATRDTMFLSEYSATVLPMVMAGSAALSFVIVIALSRLMTRYAPARVVPVVFAASAALYVVEWWLAKQRPELAAVMVYLHTAALGGAVVSSFWSVVNERFDPHTAKRVISRIGAGATIGGILGGAAAWQVGTAVNLPTMLLLLAGTNVICGAGIRLVSRGGAAPKQVASEQATSGFSTLKKIPYLRHLAAIVALLAVADVVLDYVVKARASAAYTTSDELISFFAVFYTVVGVATFLWQSTLARRFLQRVGLTGTVATLPAAYAAGGLVSLAVPGLWSVTGATGFANSVESSLFRSGYELLYTPLAAAAKRSTKTIIDVACARVGSAGGSGIALLVLALVPVATANSVLLGVAAVAGSAALMITSLLHRGYVSALADSLLRGAVNLEGEEVVDAVTRRTLADTTMALDRQKLLEEIAQLRESNTSMSPVDVEAPAKPAPAARSSPRLEDPIVRATGDLRSGDAAAIRAVLNAGGLASELVPHAISLVARNDVQRDAIRALIGVAQKHAGQLIDSLTNPRTAFAIRRRLPRVLARCPTQTAVDGLLVALGDDRFEVRYRCALALSRITREDPKLKVDRKAVLGAAQREAEVGEHLWNTQKLLDGDPEVDDATFADGASHKLGHSLEYVFTVLSLTLERQPLTLAYHALASKDRNLRGTGLEYLENVLPLQLRKVLWPYLGDSRVARDTKRERRAIVKELEASVSSMTLDRELIAKLAAQPDE